MYMTSYERVNEYNELKLPQEPPFQLPGDRPFEEGSIEFEKASLRYRPGLPLAVKSLSLSIPRGTKVGVAGRTGAGKSSLVSMLFRLHDIEADGTIKISGRDIHNAGLQSLREAITVIPQDPSLMEGTFRDNLDPFHNRSDDEIQKAMQKASLDPDLIFEHVDKGGSNLSAGQRQLVCFARAALYKTPIVVLDEPTSSCDMVTDDKVQAMVRAEFADATVITIAHRLNTIIDYDRILIMDDGRAVEYGTPADLLKKDGGHLRMLVEALGPDAAAALAAKAGGGNK